MTTLSQQIASCQDVARIVVGDQGSPQPLAAYVDAGSSRFAGDGDGDALGIVMTNDGLTLECLFGAIASGVTLVSFPQPSVRGALSDQYVKLLGDSCMRFGIVDLVARDDLADRLRDAGVDQMRAHRDLAGRNPLRAKPSGEFRLIQFSSGTTSFPKAIHLDDRALGANIAAILARVDPRAGDGVVSWLPLSHDMGLVGMLLSGAVGLGPDYAGGGQILLERPERFLRAPGLWLRMVAEHKATVTGAPDFALRLVTRRPARDPGDLSRLRCLIVGGEIVRADTLDAFAQTYHAHGLCSDAICPAYGMAEIGLAATMTPPGATWRNRPVSRRALAANRVAPPHDEEDTLALVAAGPPLPGYEVRRVSSDLVGCSTDVVGRLVVRGPSVGADGMSGTDLADDTGWLRTDDLGFIDTDGWAYVTGRADDQIVAYGRQIHAPAVEAAVSTAPGVRDGKVAAVGLPAGGWAVIVEIIQSKHDRPGELAKLRDEIRRRAVQAAGTQPDDVRCIAAGALPFTNSGKLQRHRVASVLGDCS